MIKFENISINGWEPAIRGMRNPLESWDKSDSHPYQEDDVILGYCIGPNDENLMNRLAKAGSDHRKFMRMITVYVDITAPLYWWKEFDTYKIGTVANSCSTMHTIHKKEFSIDDFSTDHMDEYSINILEIIINFLNYNVYEYDKNPDKQYWWQIIQMLPTSYNQKRTVLMNYEVLSNIYKSRKNHKLDEWHNFCSFIENLPYSNIIKEASK